MLILGIESSCDETAAAVVRDGRIVLSNEIASQIPQHRIYGGVVPEIASRLHTEAIGAVVSDALANAGKTLEEIDLIAVTYAPGLIGALLAGVSFAKGLAYAAQKPLYAVHHLHGHIAALYLSHPTLQPPFTALVASGGHSSLIEVDGPAEFKTVGRAVDDAAGEAFDKVARTLGLGYPGGPEISRLALEGNPDRYRLPDPHPGGEYDLSFSGLKTAVINLVHNAAARGEKIDRASLAASFQKRAVSMLSSRLVRAASQRGNPAVLCGGVAANRMLREETERMCAAAGIPLYVPELKYCGDNAAMIAAAAEIEYRPGLEAPLSLNAVASKEM